MSFKCPSCARPLYNRRREKCEFCGATIPDALRLSASQRQFIERLKSDESAQHRDFMQKRSLSDSPIVYVPDIPIF
jgi:ribosomal protein L37E